MSNSPRPTVARPADRLGTARADLRQRYTTTWPDGTTEVVEETALEPHERALLDDPELHGALSESLANLHPATPSTRICSTPPSTRRRKPSPRASTSATSSTSEGGLSPSSRR